MTSSGHCHECGKICFHFHYRVPFKGQGHDGFWHCDEHGPIITVTTSDNLFIGNPVKEKTHGMNRADRRYYKRTGKVRT